MIPLRRRPGQATVLRSAVVVLLGLMPACLVHAGTVWVEGNVEQVAATGDGRFGGCMAELDVELADAGLACPRRWVTFGCTGEYAETTTRGAGAVFESLRAAVVAGRSVGMRVTDEKKDGGYCHASRIKIQDEPHVDEDSDADGVFDLDDDVPLDASETVDTDDDGIGNNADADDDNDGVDDAEDAFPLDPEEHADSDGDGIGDNADPDDSRGSFDLYDFDTNSDPDGIVHVDGRFYVVNTAESGSKVYAYLETGQRDAAADFELDAENNQPTGLAHANGRFHVVDFWDAKVYAYTEAGERDAAADFELDASNSRPGGIAHANGRFHVVDLPDAKVYAYTETGERAAAADFDLVADNSSPHGIVYANGGFLVVDRYDARVYAYAATGKRAAGADFDLDDDNPDPQGIARANGRLHVVDGDNASVYAYSEAGERDAAADFSLFDAIENTNAQGMAYVDGRFFVVDKDDDRVYAYTETGERDVAVEFELDAGNGSSSGITHVGGTFYVVDRADDKVYAYFTSGGRDAARDFDLTHGASPDGITHANGRFYVTGGWRGKVYAYTENGERVPSADFDLDSGYALGIAYGNGRFYVVDLDEKVHAYTETGERVAGGDFDLEADNTTARGIAFANGRLHVTDSLKKRVYAYTENGQRDASADFDLHDADVDLPRGIAYAAGRLYVVDPTDKNVYAYSQTGERDAAATFDLDAENDDAAGIVHAGGWFYVLDSAFRENKVFAYTAPGRRAEAADFDLAADNNTPGGIAYANGRFYIADANDQKVYAYTERGERDAAADFDLGFYHAAGIAYGDGRFYVVTNRRGGDKAYAFTTSGERDAAADFDLVGDNGYPQAATVADGRLYVVDSVADRVFVYALPSKPGRAQSLAGLSTPTPWHLTDVWIDFSHAPEDIESYCVTLSLDVDVPDDVNLYIASTWSTINKVRFYGGVQTRIDGHERKDDSAPLVQRRRGAIFSRWRERAWGAIEQAPGGLVESSGHEGDFIGVRNDFPWREGSYELCLRKAAVVEGDPLPEDYEVEDVEFGWGRFVHTWVRMEVTDVASGDTTFVGALAFPGPFSMGRSNVIFVEIYGNPSPFPALDVPQFTVSFENFQVDGEDWPYERVTDISNTVPSESAAIPKLGYASYDASRGVIDIEVGKFAGEFGRIRTVHETTVDPTAVSLRQKGRHHRTPTGGRKVTLEAKRRPMLGDDRADNTAWNKAR